MPNIHQEQTETLWILIRDFALHNIRNNTARFVLVVAVETQTTLCLISVCVQGEGNSNIH